MNVVPLEERYFEWLAVQVVNPRLRSNQVSRWSVLEQLHTTEFKWFVRNDDNRAADGKELRSMFLEEFSVSSPTQEWLDLGCSFLEMLIALSGRLAFQTEGISPAEWFWHLLGNAGLDISDADYEQFGMNLFVEQVLQSINDRTYKKDGRGGLFPLIEPGVDQTKNELWTQMNYYLLERS